MASQISVDAVLENTPGWWERRIDAGLMTDEDWDIFWEKMASWKPEKFKALTPRLYQMVVDMATEVLLRNCK